MDHNNNDQRNNFYKDIGIEKSNEKNSNQRQNILNLNDKINEMEEQLTNSKRIRLSNENQSSLLNYEKEALNAAQQKINEQNALIHKLKEKNIELEIGLSSLELLKSASSELDTKNKLIDKLNLKLIDLNKNLQDARSQMELLTNENISIKKDLEIKTQTSILNFRNFACTNSEINLKLKNENLKLTADLDALKLKINNQQDLAQCHNQNETISKLELMLSKKDNEINLLKTENELVKNTNKEAYSYARYYVDKLKEFEQNLIKERLERSKNNREQEGNSLENVILLDGMYHLSGNRFVKVEKYNGNLRVNIREHYKENGSWKPTKKGISLTRDQFNCLKKYANNIEIDLRKF